MYDKEGWRVESRFTRYSSLLVVSIVIFVIFICYLLPLTTFGT